MAHEAIIALGDIGPGAKDAVPALTKALDQPDDKDMNFAAIAFALGKIGPGAAAAESALLKQLESKDDNVRLLSAWALAQIDPASADVAAKAVPVLTAGLALPVVEDRLLSAEALGGFGPSAKSAAEALKKAATDENKDVQEAAAKALKAVEQAVAAMLRRPPPRAEAGRLRRHGRGQGRDRREGLAGRDRAQGHEAQGVGDPRIVDRRSH